MVKPRPGSASAPPPRGSPRASRPRTGSLTPSSLDSTGTGESAITDHRSPPRAGDPRLPRADPRGVEGRPHVLRRRPEPHHRGHRRRQAARRGDHHRRHLPGDPLRRARQGRGRQAGGHAARGHARRRRALRRREKMPPLGGFVETKRRATAAVALVSREDDKPILASWRYGLGQVVAITTDLRGDWNGSWSHFAGSGQVLRQMVRFAMRKHSSGSADMRVTVGDHGAEATLDLAEPSGEPAAAPSTIEAFAVGEDGTAHPLPFGATLERLAPGRFRAHAKTAGEPFVVVRARDANGGFVGEAIGRLDGGEELAVPGPDERALEVWPGPGAGFTGRTRSRRCGSAGGVGKRRSRSGRGSCLDLRCSCVSTCGYGGWGRGEPRLCCRRWPLRLVGRGRLFLRSPERLSPKKTRLPQRQPEERDRLAALSSPESPSAPPPARASPLAHDPRSCSPPRSPP